MRQEMNRKKPIRQKKIKKKEILEESNFDEEQKQNKREQILCRIKVKIANDRYNIIYVILGFIEFLNTMPFFLSPVPSHFQNYCIFMPVLPYLVLFQGEKNLYSKPEITNTGVKTQDLNQNFILIKDPNPNYQKSNNSQTSCSSLKIQEKIFLQCKNTIAELQSQEIYNIRSQPGENLAPAQQSGPEIKSGTKSQNKALKSIKIKNKKIVKEEEYQPFAKKRKTESTVRQNENRNIIPNEVNQIFSYIQKSSKSQYVVSRIFKKHPPPSNQDFTMKKFYLYQSLLKEKISNYINQSSLSLVKELYEPRCQVYGEQQQRYYNKVCRMLINHFLQEDSIFNILTSRRMHKEKKRSHLEMRRVLRSKVIEILRH